MERYDERPRSGRWTRTHSVAARPAVWLALVTMGTLLAACDLLDGLGPLACHPADGHVMLALSEFRVSQTNQTHDHHIALLAGRDAGIRVVLASDVERATLATITIEIEVIRSDGNRAPILMREVSCVRPTTMASAHLAAQHVEPGAVLNLRVRDGGGEVVIDTDVAPRVVQADPYHLVLVPLRVDGVEATTGPERLSFLASSAHAMFPIHPQAITLPTFDVGDLPAATGPARSAEILTRLRAHLQLLADQDLLPPLVVGVGLIPRTDTAWWGWGGGFAAVTDERDVEMYLHEIGHALGAPHAIGCGAPDPAPESTQHVDPLGYDLNGRNWRGGNDIMSYCRPRDWLGAWAHARIMARLELAQGWGRTLAITVAPTPE